MSEAGNNKHYLSLSKFLINFYEEKKYYYYLRFFLRMQIKKRVDYYSLDSDLFYAKTSLIEFATFMKQITNNKINKFDYFLEQIHQLIEEIDIYNKVVRIRLYEYKMRKKNEEKYNSRNNIYGPFKFDNIDDIDKIKELQFKSIEEEKEKKIKECNEKYKNIMDKLDLIKDKNDFYELLKTLKLN